MILSLVNVNGDHEKVFTTSIFTKDRSLYDLCLRDIDAGVINLNRSTCGASALLPFGGVKNSGNYRPAAHGCR